MKHLFFLFLLTAISLTVIADDKIDRIYEFYEDGQVHRARMEFMQLPASALRDGNRLFLAGLFETNAAGAREFFLAALILRLRRWGYRVQLRRPDETFFHQQAWRIPFYSKSE